MDTDNRVANALAGAAIGAVAGVVGAFLMVRFQNAVTDATAKGTPTADVPKHREPGHPERKEQADASAQVAERVVELVTGKQLDREQRKRGGEVVHYAFGAAAGAVYGAFHVLRFAFHDVGFAARAKSQGKVPPLGLTPSVGMTNVGGLARGVAYGLAIWVVADLVVLPAMRLSPKPQEQAPRRLALGAVGHAIYGATLGAVSGFEFASS